MDHELAFGIVSLNKPIGVTDATLVQNFENNRNALVIARGSLLQFAFEDTQHFTVQTEFSLFGVAANVIPIRHPMDRQSNILVVLEDMRYAVLRCVSGQVTTVQFGNLCSSSGVPIDRPFRVRRTCHGILIQFFHQVVQFFRITRNSQLSAPLNCVVPVKHLIDFDLLGSCEGIPRMVFLIEDFRKKTKVQLWECDEASQVFSMKSGSKVVTTNDAYKLQSIHDNSVIVLTTSAVYRIVFHASGAPLVQSSSIFTSNPLSFIVPLSSSLLLATDQASNLMSMFASDGGKLVVNRIGEIPPPVALIAISRDSALAIAKDGKSSIITLQGKDNSLRSEIRDGTIISGTLEKVIEVNNNEFVGLCKNNRAHFVRESLKLKRNFVVSMPHTTGVWFSGQNRIIISFEAQSRMAIIENTTGLTAVSDPRMIENEPTLCVGILDANNYVQVTRTTVNVTNGSRLVYSHIICGYVRNGLISIVHENYGKYATLVLNSLCQTVMAIDLPGAVETVACNGTLLAVASWTEHSVFAYNVGTGELVRTIRDVTGIGMAFTGKYLVVADAKNASYLYSLDNECEVHSLHCEGIHSSLVQLGGERVIVCGDDPVLLDGPALKGIEFDEFTHAASFEDLFVFSSHDKLFVCTSMGFGLSVREESLACDILDVEPMQDSNKFAITLRSENLIVVGMSDNPLATSLHPSIIFDDSYGVYVGITSCLNDATYLISIVFSKALLLYDFSDNTLQKRSELPFSSSPFCVLPFRQGFLVGFRTVFHLYQPDFVSRSDIRLKKITEMLTQGSSSYIDTDESIVAVADQLQSLVLYEYNEDTCKFTEAARHCADLGLSCCKMRGDDYFCADNNGRFFRLVIGETRNLESCDLVIAGCCTIGQVVRSIGVLSSKDCKLILGTELGQYIEVITFQHPRSLAVLYDQLSQQAQSLGNFHLRSYRTVVLSHAIPHVPILYDLDLLHAFLRLDARLQEMVSTKAGLTAQAARQICLDTISRA